MSTNAENNDKKIGVVAGEQTNGGDPSISSQAKLNQEHQKEEIAAKTPTPPATSTATVTNNTTQTKEELQTKPKQTSTHSTDLTQTKGNKSGGTPAQPPKSKLKRFSTAIGKGLNWGNRNRLQGRDNEHNELYEDMKSQNQDNSATDPQPRPAQGEKTPEQHRATDLPQNNEDSTTKVGDSTEQQQDQDQDGFVRVESPEPDRVSKHEKEIASLNNLMADHTKAIASLEELMVQNNKAIASLRAQLSQDVPGLPTPNDKVGEIKPVLEVTTSPIQERPGEDLVFRKADGISLTEVANLVRELNAQIDQAASLIMDLLLSRESSSSSKDSSIAWDGLHDYLHDYLGSWLCDELQRTSEEPEIDQTVAHIALQAGLVHACSRIVNDWNPPFWAEGEAFSRVYDSMAGAEGPITADTWRALARNHMALREDQLEANKKYLEDVLLKLIIAVSGSLQSGDTLLQQCNEKVDDIARKAVDIHRVISREARSTDLSTFTVESGTEFDQSRMEDTEESNRKAGPTSPSKVVCTVEMGLRGRKRVPSRQQSGDGNLGKVGSVTLKAKVVLPATLGEL